RKQFDGYEVMVKHAARRKDAFDQKVMKRRTGPAVFETGDLVQVYRSDLDYTFKIEQKLLPKWSRPQWVVER
ncbi:hypothetical protein BT96DRAFT_767317, partial [Gymnopus androsaceus JB14]